MNTQLEIIQAAGPRDRSKAGYNAWYDDILLAANGIQIRGISKDSALAPKEEQPIDWNPITKQWGRAGYQEDDM
jgi:hypothetical protein